jgi:hypothetical protein
MIFTLPNDRLVAGPGSYRVCGERAFEAAFLPIGCPVAGKVSLSQRV